MARCLRACLWVTLFSAVACSSAKHRTDDHHAPPAPPAAPPAVIPVPGPGLVPPNGLVHLDGLPAARNNAASVTLRVTGTDLAQYRYKFGPAGAETCADGAGYGPPAPATTALTLDQSALADGEYRLCILGQDARGTWQDPAAATVATWVVERHGPGAFTINPVDFPAGAVHVSWTAPAPAPAASFTMGIAGPDGCGSPVQTVKTSGLDATLATPPPGGHYRVCVTAIDDLGNSVTAANDGQVAFDRPAQLAFTFFQGKGAEGKALLTATGLGLANPFHVVSVPLPADGARFAGRAALQLDGAAHAQVAYQAVVQPDLSPPQLALGLSSIGDGGTFEYHRLAIQTHPGSAGAQIAFALLPNGEQHVAALGQDRGAQATPQVLLDGSAVATGTALDVDLAVDGKGRQHLAYARGAEVLYQLKDGQGWSAPRSVAPGCLSVTAATLAVGAADSRHVAYLCTRREGAQSKCVLGLATSLNGAAWQSVDVATVDPAAGCLPFGSGRPAVVADGQGKAHLFWRYTDAAHPGAYDVAFGVAGVPPQTLGEWGLKTGYPQLALDATDQAYALYLAGDQIKVAFGDGSGPLAPAAVKLDGDGGVPGAPLQLGNLLVHGGHGHGAQPYAH